MSFISTWLIAVLSNRTLSSLTYKNLAKRFVKSYFKENEVAFFDDVFIKQNNIKEHNVISFDGVELKAYELNKINSNNYIIYVYGFDQKLEDLQKISLNFEKNGFNSIFIKNRNFNTLGIKESLDLLVWIDYFSNQIFNANFILYGEKLGASLICKALASRMNQSVKKVVLDDLKSSYFDDLVREYSLNNHVENVLKLAKNIKLELNKQYMYSDDEFNLKKAIETNNIPVLFVQSKHVSKYDHNELLKIFNSTKGERKIFYTNSITKNCEQENYFEVVSSFIKN